MKRLISIITSILTLTSIYHSHAQSTNEFTVPLSEPSKRGKLKVSLNSGSITVKGTSRKDILIRYSTPETKQENARPVKEDDSRSRLKRMDAGGLDIEVTEHQNNVQVESGSWTKPVNIEVEIPSGFDVFLHTYNNGFLMVSHVQGAVELENFNGKITALNVSGSVVASTYNGDIKVSFDKATPNTPMSFSTYNGDIDITLPADYKASLKARSERGSIYSAFDIQFKSTGPVQKQEKKGDVYKVVVDEWKLGDINGGGPELTLQNYNGDLILRNK